MQFWEKLELQDVNSQLGEKVRIVRQKDKITFWWKQASIIIGWYFIGMPNILSVDLAAKTIYGADLELKH